MSLTVIGAGAAYEFRWRSWALLRDVVVASLEGGELAFPCFSSIGDALVAGKIDITATALLAEIGALRRQLSARSLDELVIGPRTASVLYLGSTPRRRRGLTRHEVDEIRPIGDSTNLAEYFATMLDSLDHVCNHPNSDDTIEVVDG